MAMAGVGSRRASEELIEQGRVRINGRLAKLGDQADPKTDVIEVDGRRLKIEPEKKIYIAVNKPKHVVTSNVHHRGDARQTIFDLVPHKGHLFTIGRLDAESEGLVVLTNDGDLAYRLSHPRFQHTKSYKVIVQGLPTAETIQRWQTGVQLEEGKTAPAYVHILKGATNLSILRVVMTEGKKRQIRRVAALLGHRVRRLVRTRIGMLELGDLPPGQWRELTPKEVNDLATPSPEIKELRRASGRRGPRRDGGERPERRREPQAAGQERSAPGESRPRRDESEGRAARPGERPYRRRDEGESRSESSDRERPRSPRRDEGESRSGDRERRGPRGSSRTPTGRKPAGSRGTSRTPTGRKPAGPRGRRPGGTGRKRGSER